ncbi:MAG: formylglycine-generating enzyme family protein, partial [Elusimicrobiota bacterium]
AADLYPGYGATMSANSAAGQPRFVTVLLYPANNATDVSQSPSLNVTALIPNATVQYNFQVDTLQTMNSQSGNPQGDFDQTVAQLFASSGAFSGQDKTIAISSDAYLGASTATFAFYSSSAKLNANTVYYWRARAKPSTGVYGEWSSTFSFTTGQFASANPANHLAISGVTMSGVTGPGLATISFNIAENNVTTGTSTNGGAYNTADWVFVKFSTAAGADGTWQHATLTGGTVGAGATLAAASDNKGVYLNHTTNSLYWTSSVNVTWNLAADGILFSKVYVKVFAISMVKVPTGDFIYNVSNIGGSTFNNYNSGTQAIISGPGTATGTGTNNLPLDAPVGWPNGYSGFYIGRYEITQGQYADFLNTIPSTLASSLHYGTVANGHNMTYTAGNSYGLKYAAVDPNAAKNYLSFDDGWRYLSWAGLRPPTEMEFEKAGRDLSPDARIYPWGSTPVPDWITYAPRNEGGNLACIRRYMNYGNLGYCTRVLDVGRYMGGDVYRTTAETGASPWGIADLAGNVWELVINSKWASVPLNGNGTPTLPATWPVPGADTAGDRGGGWGSDASGARVSDRYFASWANTNRNGDVGARGCRTP